MFYYKITGKIVNEETVDILASRSEGIDARIRCSLISEELFEKS